MSVCKGSLIVSVCKGSLMVSVYKGRSMVREWYIYMYGMFNGEERGSDMYGRFNYDKGSDTYRKFNGEKVQWWESRKWCVCKTISMVRK